MGWVFNIVDQDAATNVPTIAAVGVIFMSLSLMILSLRLYVKGWLVKNISIDDWIIVGTWIMSCVFTALTLAQTRWGLGLLNVEDIPPQNVFYFNLIAYAASPFYICGILGFKISLLGTFLSMTTDMMSRMSIIGIGVTCTMFHFCFLVVQLKLCNPTAKQWDPSITTGSCLSPIPLYTAMAVITIIFEILIMLTPIPILLYASYPRSKNFLIGFLFMFGSFITSIQIIRILTITSGTSMLSTSSLLLWSMVEISLGIILSCLIPLSPLLRSVVEQNTLDTFKLELRVDHVKLYIQRVGRESKTWNRIVMFLGYGELPAKKATDSRAGSRLGQVGTSTEELGFPMGIIKTTEVIISREGSDIWDSPMENKEYLD